MVMKKIACRWIIQHQHKLTQVIGVRCCHMPAFKRHLENEEFQVSIENETVEKPRTSKLLKPPKAYKPQDIATKSFLADPEYKFEEIRAHPQRSFKYSDLEVRLAGPESLRPKPDIEDIQFGTTFTDHMLKIYYHKALGGWQTPQIIPFENITLHPAAKVLHYAVELFEGMKAFRGRDDRIRLFRPLLNMERMNASAVRAGLPTFDNVELARCISRLISIDQDWIPHSEAASLYIRPTLIGIDGVLGVASADSALLYTIMCPVGSYFDNGIKSVSLIADPNFTRAWRGGCGDRKMGSNYGPTIKAQIDATNKGRQQQLWLYGEDHEITEVGTMNIFIAMINEEGERELITPPLNGLILPGITRHSLLQMARKWNEFKVIERKMTMRELISLLNQNRILEVFGAGTACVVSPVSLIEYLGQELKIPTVEQRDPIYKRLYTSLTAIQYGHEESPWADIVD